jgi:bifunctional non-homologous end joining protein LigD
MAAPASLRARGHRVLVFLEAGRRELLQEMLAKVQEPVLEFSAGVVGNGRDFFARVVAQGHEGVMAKDLGSRYYPGKRSSAWRKIKPVAVIPCVVVGYTAGREGVRRLLLATVHDGTLRYVGTLGQGLGGPEIRRQLARRLETLRRSGPVVPCLERALWVDPRVYCQVRIHGWTLAGHLRHAVFCGWSSGDWQRQRDRT